MSSSTTSISGLVSGIDSKSIISQLMQIAAQPQVDLKTKLASTNAQISAAQGINAKAASMTSLAATLADPATYTKAAASSSSGSVTATADATAGTGSITFNVMQLATSHVLLSARISSGTAPSISVGSATYSAGTVADLASAINKDGNATVTATVIADGTDQRLQLTAKQSGQANQFTVTGSGFTDSSGASTSTVVTDGQDAQIRIGDPSATNGAVTISSSTNTFTNLMQGVNVTVSAVTTSSSGGANSPVTVSTAVNQGALSAQLNGLVTGMNAVLDDIAFHTQIVGQGITPSATNGGLLQGDGTLRDTAGSLLSTVSDSVGSTAATLAGLGVTRDGHITFDASKFSALYASNPAQAASVLQAFGAAVKAAGTTASDPVSGAITGLVNGDKSDVTNLTNSIADWDTRLQAKQALLTAQYAALEVALGKIKDQGNAVTAALGQLSGNNNNN